ncbi:MAG: O-antigen ligase family protein [Nitrospira sp.]
MKITKNILIYSILAGLFITPFIAFFVPSTMFFPFISGKGFAFRIIVEIIFGLYVILASISPEYRPKMSWVTKSVLFFTAAILLADLLGVNVYKSIWSNYERMEGFVLIAHLALYYIVASSFLKTVSRWNQYFNVTLGASVLMSIYSLLQLAGKIKINQGGVRVDATFGNSSYLAIYLVLHIFLAMYMIVGADRAKWQKWLYGAIAVFETIILYFTATRGAILGLIGGLILTGLIIVFKEKENVFLRKVVYGFFAGVVLLVIGFISIKDTQYVKTSQVLSRFSTLSFSEIKTQGRYFVWPMAVKGFIERPVFGWGQENFNFVFNKNYDPRMYAQEQWFDRTHNVFLDWLIAGGLIGFLAYASMYVALFYYIWRRESVLTLSERSIMTGMISAYIFHNMFVFDNLISYILFFSMLAYIHSISTSNKIETNSFYTKTISDDVVNYAVLPVVTVLVIAGVYFINIPAIKANQTLIQAITPQKAGVDKNLDLFKKIYSYNSFGSTEALEQLVQISTQVISGQFPVEIKQKFADFAKEKVDQKVSSTPKDARYLVFAGSFYSRIGQNDEAIKYLNTALVESPKKQTIYFELGSVYANKGDFVKMFEVFKQAYDLEKNSNESKIMYAIAAIYTKNNDLLKQLINEIGPDTVLNDDRLLKAFSNIGDYGTAINMLNARLQKDPSNSQNKLYLASIYASVGQKDQAILIIRGMIAQNPSFKDEGEGYIKQILSQ